MVVFYDVVTQGGQVNRESVYQMFNGSKLVTSDMPIVDVAIKYPRSGNKPFMVVTFQKENDVKLILSKQNQVYENGKKLFFKLWHPPKETNMLFMVFLVPDR